MENKEINRFCRLKQTHMGRISSVEQIVSSKIFKFNFKNFSRKFPVKTKASRSCSESFDPKKAEKSPSRHTSSNTEGTSIILNTELEVSPSDREVFRQQPFSHHRRRPSTDDAKPCLRVFRGDQRSGREGFQRASSSLVGNLRAKQNA